MFKVTCILLALLFAPMFAIAQNASGVFMIVKGDVKVTTKAGATEPARAGKKVAEGDTIVSGADSRAKIVMSDKNVINVLPDSKMTISKYQGDAAKGDANVELKVEYGKVRAAVEQKYDGDKSKFNIKTPSAVAGVRGTDFMMGYSAGTKESSVVTFTGSVALGKPGANGSISGAVYVNQGEASRQVGNNLPEAPKAMDQGEIQKLNNDSSDNGGKKQDVATGDTKTEDAKKEEAKKEEPKKDEPKKEEAKKEEPKKEEPKKETAKTEEKKDSAKKDEPKRSVASETSTSSDTMMMPTIDAPPPPKINAVRVLPTPPPPPPTPHPAVNQNSKVNVIINQGQ